MKKLYLFLISIFISFYGFADIGPYKRSFKSENGIYELRILGHKYGKVKSAKGEEYETIIETTWGLYNLLNGRELYTVKGDFPSKLVFVSDDGRNLVVLDSFSEGSPSPDLRVVEFYTQGRLVNAFTLGKLLCSYLNITEYVSHFTWLADYKLVYAPNLKFTYDIRKLIITTYELNTFVFDIKTGDMLKKELSPDVNKNSVLVYGEVKYLGKENYEIDVCHRVYGKVPESGKIQFTSEKRIDRKSGSSQTVLINNGQYTQTNHRMQDWVLNLCRFKHGNQAERNENNCL